VKDKFLTSIIFFVAFGLLISNASAQQNGMTQVISCPACGPLFFPLNSPRVGEEHAACLDHVALLMVNDKNLMAVFDGHRDSKERKGISITRVNFDRRYLIEERGIDPSRIVTRNFSDTCPHDGDEAVFNRRVEFWLMPKGTDLNTTLQTKKCRDGFIPKIITTEKPAAWNWKKKGWTRWGE
jgi:hypothetical protein